MYARKSLTKKQTLQKCLFFYRTVYKKRIWQEDCSVDKKKTCFKRPFFTSTLPIQRQAASDFIDTLFLAF